LAAKLTKVSKFYKQNLATVWLEETNLEALASSAKLAANKKLTKVSVELHC
jgi:hypothetical protein